MGSEHYCLRWNNHQSNLLGVFSQLLESESLVDVTLACTEGPSIRAHKVVLSACSSYFQALFLDHPNRHPIVILKDVRFTELRTLVDFMYKGEVNVEYCQLSALLKTAESLKVKGLADMTSINSGCSTTREEPQVTHQQQQMSHQQQQHAECAREREKDKEREKECTAASMSMTTTTTTTTTTTLNAASASASSSSNPTNPIDCNDHHHHHHQQQQPQQHLQQQQQQLALQHQTAALAASVAAASSETVEAVDMTDCPGSPIGPPSPCPGPLALDRPRRDSEDAVSLEETRGSLSPISVHSGPSDMSLSNNNANATGVLPLNLPQSRLPSPHSTEPLAGPSGLPPVQQVPLSLKKEVDWERPSEERCASSEISTDYRLPPDPVSLFSVSLALGLEAGGWGALVERAGNHSSSPLLAHSAGFAGLASLARRCGVCLATFPSAWLLERHALLQHAGQPNDDKPFTCEQCGQRYRYRSAYVKHREQNHRARLPADKLFTCDVCGMQFRYLKSFKKHRLNHALERLQRGTSEQASANNNNNNNNSTTSSSSLSSLLSRVERSDQVSSTGEPSLLETGSNHGDPEDLTREAFGDNARDEATSETASVQENADLQDVQAMDLGSGAASGGAGGTSIVTGGNQAPGPTESEHGDAEDNSNAENIADELEQLRNAEANGDRVISLVNPRAHHHHHHENDRRERRFACPFCGKCVRSKENLKLHVRKHTGERPFVCLFCGRAFGGKSDLTRHLRIHTGERPYHCEMCGKCFARADYLSKHLTTHIHHNHQR